MPICNPKAHWWSRTPPRPFDPSGFTAENARCLCGQYTYSQREVLVVTGATIGTYVPEPHETRVMSGRELLTV